jgi:uncharacterized protein
MAALVLDAWAVMAWLKGQQPATHYVRKLLHASGARSAKPSMNIVNLGEVFYLSVKARDVAFGQRVLENLRTRITTISASEELVMSAASLKSRHAISYADAFAAATAILVDARLVTGDPELRIMSADEKKLKIEWIAG